MSNRKKLYEALVKDYDMGTFEQFEKDIQDDTKRRKLYDAIIDDYDMGSYEQFSSQVLEGLNVAKKDSLFGPPPAPKQVQEQAEEANDGVIRGFGGGVKQGTEQLLAGGEYAVAEYAEKGSDYDRAYNRMGELIDEGTDFANFDVEAQINAQKKRDYYQRLGTWNEEMAKRREERKAMGVFEAMKHRLDDPSRPRDPFDRSALATAEKYTQEGMDKELDTRRTYTLIEEALREAGGDVEKARAFLDQRRNEGTWADRWQEDAQETFANAKPTEGFGAWVGNMVPQMVGNVAAILASTNPYTRILARPLGMMNTAALTASSAGSAMAEARRYGEEHGVEIDDATARRAGLLAGGIEQATEQIPFDRYFNVTTSFTKKALGKAIGETISESPAAKNELSKLIERASKELGGELINGHTIKEWAIDAGLEGVSEFLAEGGGALVPMIYQNEEDYPTLKEILVNGWEGAKAGMFMGAFLGGANRAVLHYGNKQRRKEAGVVTLAETKDGVVEVVGTKDGKYIVMRSDGQRDEVTKEELIETTTVPYSEFYGEVLEAETMKANDEGRKAQLDQFYGIDQTLRSAEQVINDMPNAEELWDAVRAIENAPKNEREGILSGLADNERQLILDYLNAKSREQGVIDGREEQTEDLVSKYAATKIDPFAVTDANGNRTVTTATLRGREVYVSSIQGENAVIWALDGVGKEMIPLKELENVQTYLADELIERFRQTTTAAVEEETDRYMEYPAEVQEPAQGVTVETLDGKQWQVAATDGENVEIVGLVFDKKSGQWIPNSGDYRKMTREQFMDWQKAELDRKKANTYEQGDELIFYVKGEPIDAEITGIDPEGNYMVQISHLSDGLNKAVSDVYTAEELRKLTTPSSKVSEKTNENESTPTEEIKQSVSEEVTNSQIGENVTEPIAEVVEDVNTPQAKATELLAELEEDEVDENVAYNAQKALDAAEKTRKAKPTMKDADGDVAAFKALKSQWQAELDEAQREVLFWDNVAKEVQRQREASMSEQVAMSAQAPVAEAVEVPSVSPIAEAAPVAKPKRAKRQRQAVSFDDFGDAAMDAANEILQDRTPQNGEELVAWMLTGPKGIKLIPESFRAHTGYSKSEQRKLFQIMAKKENGGVTMERFGELVMLADREDGTNFFDQTDANAGLSAVLELLSQVETIGDINNYILRNREEMAYREASAVQAAEDAAMQEAKDAWYMEQYHATEEELAAYNEYLAEFAEEIYGEDADYEQRIATFAEIQLGEYDNQGTDAGLRSSADQGEGLASDREGGRSVGETEQLDRREVLADAAGVAEAEDGRAGGSVSTESDVDAAESVETLENGDVRRTNRNSRGEIATVVIERDGNIISVDTYEDGALFERTDYDANGNATKVTRYKDGEVVSEQEYKDGKRKVTANYFEMAEEAQKKRNAKKKNDEEGQEPEAREARLRGNVRGKVVQSLERKIREYEERTGWTKGFTKRQREILEDLRNATDNELINTRNRAMAENESDVLDVLNRYARSGERLWLLGEWGITLNEPVSLSKIDELFGLFNRDDEMAALYARVLPIIEQISPTFSFETIRDKDGNVEDDVAGRYSLKSNRIRLNKHLLNSTYTSDVDKARAIVHEMLHAVAQYAVDAKERMNKGEDVGIKIDEGLLEAAQSLIDVYEQIKDNKALKGEYGTTDVHEMISEFAKPIFRDKLKKIYIGERSAWQKIKDFFYRIIKKDMQGSSVYAQAKKALDYLIDNFDGNAYVKSRGLSSGTKEARVYHGSGAQFDKFDHSFMGTGEGNQAFGWGTYVSEAKGVAKTYGEIASTKTLQYQGKEVDTDGLHNPWRLVQDLFEDTRGKLREMRSKAERYESLAEEDSDMKPIWGEVVRILKDTRSGDLKMKPKRVLYDVEIPDNNGSNYLEWYEAVPKELLNKAKQKLYDILIEGDYKGAERELKRELDDLFALEQTGQNLYGNISAYLGSDKEASQFLRELGIVGMKYPTNTLHGGNIDGTNNYVIFDENDLEIVDNMRFRDGAPFFSNAERAVESIKQQKATPEQWLAMIKKDGGLKAGEDKWMGLSDWLNEQKEKGVKTLTKDEVLQFIRENQIEIEEVEYGDLGDTRLEELQAEFDELVGLGEEETGSIYTSDWADWAFEAMVERYGDDFREAFRVEQGYNTFPRLEAEEDYDGNMSDAAKYFLGANPINSTRLDYTTEGLDNKKEIAFVVPSIESWNRNDEVHFGDAGEGRAVTWARFGETTDEDGNRVLVIDEVQSKRHDEGRAKGYKPRKEVVIKATEAFQAFNREMREKYGDVSPWDAWSEEEQAELTRLTREHHSAARSYDRGIPDAPFDKNYHELAMKRMLRYAAENGFDKVAWNTGKQVAKRFGLSIKVSSIEYKPLANGHYNVTAYGTNGYPIEGVPVVYNNEQEIAETFGRGIAEKIVNDIEESKKTLKETNDALRELKERRKGLDEDSEEYEEIMEEYARLFALQDEANSAKSIEGEDLSIGGEDRVALYDEMIPRFMNKYVKKWGTKVDEVTLPEVEEAGRTMWSVDVTPEMRESVMQGQPMFREGMGAVSDREVSYENDPIAKWQGKPRYYGKRAAAFAERERRRMAQAAEATAKTLGLDVEVVTDAATASQLTQQRMKRRPKAKGWYDVETGKIVVVVPNHVSAGDAVRTVLHEGVAHHGLRNLFGDGFDAMLDNIYNNVAPELKARIDAIAERTGVSTSVATEEYLASLAEETNFEYAQRTGWWTKIKGYFMKMLRKLGMHGITLREEISDNELRYLLWRSYQNLVAPNSYLKPLGYLDDVAKQKELKVGEYAEIQQATPRAAEDAAKHKDSERRKALNKYKNNYDNALSFATGIPVERVRNERRQREEQRKVDAKEIYESVLSGDFNDVTLQKINDYIEDVTPQNPYGRRISQRLPQELERSLHEGARANAVDALFSRISESAVPADERVSEAGRRKAEERKKELLKGWAIATGNWHTDLSAFVDDTTPIGEGTDSKVYISKDGAYVIKVSKGKPYGKRFRPDMDNVALFNFVFPNSAYEILGYGEIEGNFVRILKQPIVDFTNTTPLTPEEREGYMRELKFKPINESKTAFSNGKIVISDLQKSNIIKDAAGNISVIDADAKLHTKDVGGDYTYPPVERDLPRVNDDGAIRYRTSEEIEAEYPNWMEGTTTDSGKHSTQVEGTRKTYNKVGDWIEENLGKEVSILDASSGMGYGTADLRERGFNIEDVEPYQSEERKKNNPATYSSYADIDKKYDFIISNAVLNVIPDDWRRDVLHNMAERMNDGGKLFINTRKAGEEKAIKDKIELDTPQEVLVKRNGKIASYQKFFTPQELKAWVESELGDGYVVEVANKKNSGTSGLAAVVVTKKADNGLRYKAESSLESQLDEMLTEYEEDGIIYATPRDLADGLESILAEFDGDDAKELSEILDDFMRDQAESRSWGERMDAGGEDVFIDRLFEYRDKMRNRTSKQNSEEIIAEVERESGALGVPVRIARSVDELPDEDTRKRAVDGKLKGYYDPRTNEVVLYAPNTDDANDAKRTILHEIVGHKGLRQLIGEERYDKAMVQLMYMLPSEVRDAVLRRAERHGWNAAIAMDEYLAEQAERDVQPTWWGKVNAKIRALLRNLGFDVMLTDADVTYLLWRSRKKLQGDTAFDMATDAILKQAARKSVDYNVESDNAIRYRGVEQGKKISEAVSDYYEKYTATTNADKFLGGVKYMATHLGDGGIRALLNDLSESQFEDIRSVRVLEEAIESAEGKPLRENEMVHKSLNAKTSRDARDMDKSQIRYFQPMAKLLGKILGKKIDGRKIEIDDVERYLICKHSPENNEFLMKRAHAENRRKKIHERAKELMKGTMTEEEAIAQATSEYTLHQSDFRDDYSGLTELFPDDIVREAKITERTEELTSNGVDEDTARQMASREFESYEPTLEDREKMAADEVARFEAAVDGLHEELWGIINGINRDTIERLFRSGLISRSLYNDLKKRHKFYVPLSGWKNDAAADIYNYAMYGFDGTPIQTVIKKAFGTKYQARNILGSMFAMNMAAITEGNQNLVKQKLYSLALNHDTGVLQIVDLWEVKDGEGDAAEWKPAPKPELRPTMSDAEMQKALTDYQNKLMEMEKDGMARKAVNSLADNFGKHTTDKEAKRHHVELLVNGRKVVIWVNGNPKLTQAINGDLKVKKELLFFNDAVDKANRFLAQVQTSLNPEFMISNFERDILSASRYNLIKYGPKYEASFMKHLAQLMPIVSETSADMRSDVWGGAGIFNLFALDRNTNNPNRKPDAQVLDMNNPLHREFVNFLNYGGKTGYVERKQAEDLQQRIKKLSKREQSIIRKIPAELAGWAVDTIEHLNEGIENATRFAAYLTARERGKSVTEAVFEAKEVSVNFNMQGSGAWGNASFRKLYNYFNVGLQSLRREKNLGREHPKAYIANLAFMMALGAISTVLLTADWDGDDEDEYMGLSDFNRYNYINVKTENGFIHYSLPQDLRAFYAIGCISTEWAMGKIDGSRAVQAYATQANNYTPLSFVSTTIDREPDSNPLKNLAMSFVPSAAVPVAEIAVNEDFLGRRINNQNQWNEYEPEWQRAGYRTPEWVINASKTLSEAGGGTEHKRGVWFTEINPSNAWHIMDSYGGGFLDFAQKTYNLVERELTGEEHELRDYPMVSKFYVESGQDYSKQRVVNDRYRMYREDYKTIDNELNGYLKDKNNALGKLFVRAEEEGLSESVVNKERAEIEKIYEDNVKRVKESPNYWIYESFVPYEKDYNSLDRDLGEVRKYGSEQTEKELSGAMYDVRKEVVDEIDAKRSRPIDRVRQWLGN